MRCFVGRGEGAMLRDNEGETNVILRPTMSVTRAASIEIPVRARTGAADAALGAAAYVDVGDGRDVGGG